LRDGEACNGPRADCQRALARSAGRRSPAGGWEQSIPLAGQDRWIPPSCAANSFATFFSHINVITAKSDCSHLNVKRVHDDHQDVIPLLQAQRKGLGTGGRSPLFELPVPAARQFPSRKALIDSLEDRKDRRRAADHVGKAGSSVAMKVGVVGHLTGRSEASPIPGPTWRRHDHVGGDENRRRDTAAAVDDEIVPVDRLDAVTRQHLRRRGEAIIGILDPQLLEPANTVSPSANAAATGAQDIRRSSRERAPPAPQRAQRCEKRTSKTDIGSPPSTDSLLGDDDRAI